MKIDLNFSRGKAYVWNAEDWKKLRKHRIVGELIGTISPFPRHCGFQGLPMMLMTEEAKLLVEEGVCRLVEMTDLTKSPSDDIVEASEKTSKTILTEQLEYLKEKRIEQIESKIDFIIAGKTKKMQSQGKTANFSKQSMIDEEVKKIQPPNSSQILVQIPIEHPWPLDVRIVSIDELVPNLNSPEGKLKYTVFKDLRRRGHYITAGTKFGGDYLVYPGDPVKYHATYIVRCIKNEDENIPLIDVVAFGRLGVSVNKLTVFAYINCDNRVCYQTVQWHETLY